MDAARPKLAFVSSPYLGWGSIRKRWEKAFSEDPSIDFVSVHWEEKALQWRRIYERTGRLQSLWFGMAGRESCLQAIRSGHTTILLTTVAQAGLLPRRTAAKFYIYGDSTPAQLQELYGGRSSPLGERLAYIGLRRASENVHFLCVSHWYKAALRAEYGIVESRTSLLPFAADTDLWTPGHRPEPSRPLVVFIGGDFIRKGGPLLREVAASMVNEADFVYVTREEQAPGQNETFRTGLTADSPDLIEIMRSATVFVIPSLADCSSIVSIEAASCAKPVVASAVGGIPEVVIDGTTGMIVAEHSAEAYRSVIRRYLGDRMLRELHGANGRKHATEHHSLAAQISKLKRLLDIQ